VVGREESGGGGVPSRSRSSYSSHVVGHLPATRPVVPVASMSMDVVAVVDVFAAGSGVANGSMSLPP